MLLPDNKPRTSRTIDISLQIQTDRRLDLREGNVVPRIFLRREPGALSRGDVGVDFYNAYSLRRLLTHLRLSFWTSK